VFMPTRLWAGPFLAEVSGREKDFSVLQTLKADLGPNRSPTRRLPVVLPEGYSDRSVQLNTDVYLMPKSRTIGAIQLTN
jgi:hypothetical protein